MVCVGGGIDINLLVLAAACCVCGLVLGRGRGGAGVGVALLVVGGAGRMLRWLGVRASLWVVWVLRVRAVRSLQFLAGCGVEVWVGGGRMGVRVGLRSVGNGCRWMVLACMGCVWGGCWWCRGAPTRPWCCQCWCAAPRWSMGV